METFLTIFAIVLVILTGFMLNLVIYKALNDDIKMLPKWLKRLLLLPPLPMVTALVIAMLFSITYVIDGIKKYW